MPDTVRWHWFTVENKATRTNLCGFGGEDRRKQTIDSGGAFCQEKGRYMSAIREPLQMALKRRSGTDEGRVGMQRERQLQGRDIRWP